MVMQQITKALIVLIFAVLIIGVLFLFIIPISSCSLAGGSVSYDSIFGVGCIMPTSDEGKACMNSAQCEGECLLPGWTWKGGVSTLPEDSNVTGRCSGILPPIMGCHCYLENRTVKCVCIE